MEEKDEKQCEETESKKETSNGEAKKLIFSLCYLWGILFFLPLILYKDDSSAKFHANQGLVLLIFSVAGNMVFGILTLIPIVNILFTVLSCVYSLALLALGIIGIVNTVNEKLQPLPVIGKFTILK